MDPSTLVPFATSVVAIIVAYLKGEAVHKAADKAAEVVGEKTTDVALSVGSHALAALRSKFQHETFTDARLVLGQVTENPGDIESQEQLVNELVRLAADDRSFAKELRTWASHATAARSANVLISNQAANRGAQGVFNAPVVFNRKR